jgi:hypothetical protein
VDGRIEDLEHDLIDENLKGIDEWIDRQNAYSRKDAEHELVQAAYGKSLQDLFARDPLCRRAALKTIASRMPARGLLYFLYAYVWRLGFLDGRDGFVLCRMRALYQTMVAIKKYDAGRRPGGQH